MTEHKDCSAESGDLLHLVSNLRSHRIMCDGGNGNVYDIADEDCERAADFIELTLSRARAQAEPNLLQEIHDAVNDLGGRSDQDNSYDQGIVDTVAKVLEIIERAQSGGVAQSVGMTEALAKTMEIVEMAASDDYAPAYVSACAKKLMYRLEPWPAAQPPAATVETARSDGKTIGEFYGDCRPSSSAVTKDDLWAAIRQRDANINAAYAILNKLDQTPDVKEAKAALCRPVTFNEPQEVQVLDFFSQSVDAWGALEWFDRLAKAVREQDKAVVAGDMMTMETCRNVASSSAMRLVRDYEPLVRAALSLPRPTLGGGK